MNIDKKVSAQTEKPDKLPPDILKAPADPATPADIMSDAPQGEAPVNMPPDKGRSQTAPADSRAEAEVPEAPETAETEVTEAPETETAGTTEAPETETAGTTEAPETGAAETEAPETAETTEAPKTEAPETGAAETPETETPETEAPETGAAETAPADNRAEAEVPGAAETEVAEAPETTEAPETGAAGAGILQVPCAADGDMTVVKHLPRTSLILFIIAGVSALIYAAAVIWEPFADFFSRYPGSVVRAALAYITGWIPFSLAECMLLFLPVAIFFLMRIAIKKYSDSWHNTFVYVGILLSGASLLLTIFVLGFGTGYHGSTLDKKLGLERADISAEELRDTALILAGKVNEQVPEVGFRYQDFSVMPYSYDEMCDKLIDAYDRVCDKYGFVQRLTSRVKPVMLSEAMSYTHITGVYTYFTGEANINVNFPDYTIPYTAAHELAHQRGIAREDEANFMAFLVCVESDDPYIRYSGYQNMYEYVSGSLYSADSDMYFEVLKTLNISVRYEMSAYSEFYDKYRESVAATVSGAVNDAYLKIQGTAGTKSYGMVTDLVVAYYKSAN